MKINKRLIPIKLHYFFFFGCTSPIDPFLTVVANQLGIPSSVQGTLSAVILLLAALVNPITAALVDTSPHLRKNIFKTTIFLSIVSHGSIGFIPSMKEMPIIRGQFVRASIKNEVFSNRPMANTMAKEDGQDFTSQPLLLTYNSGSCYVDVAWDCFKYCRDPLRCNDDKRIAANIHVRRISDDSVSLIAIESPEVPYLEDKTITWNALNEESHTINTGHLYQLGVNISWDLLAQNIRPVYCSLGCNRADWIGSNCTLLFHRWEFWTYVMLLLMGKVSFNTANSISDAIAVDLTSDDPGAYGTQRAWGTIGMGFIGPLSGLLVDLWSGSSVTKDYTPAFLLVFALGYIDLVICSSSLEVPLIENNTRTLDISYGVGTLLRQPRFFIFCCFVVINGMLEGIVFDYLFVMQEEMARGTSSMSFIKFYQGLTLFVQSAAEALFMFVNGWLIEKFGAQKMASLAFFFYTFRMLSLSLVGFYGPVWAILVTEILNGPTFGISYTANVIYAAQISPPGASTTIQSIVNVCFESIGFALAAFLGGMLFDVIGGPQTFMVIGITSFIVFILHVMYSTIHLQQKGDIEGVADCSIETVSGNLHKEELKTYQQNPT